MSKLDYIKVFFMRGSAHDVEIENVTGTEYDDSIGIYNVEMSGTTKFIFPIKRIAYIMEAYKTDEETE